MQMGFESYCAYGNNYFPSANAKTAEHNAPP